MTYSQEGSQADMPEATWRAFVDEARALLLLRPEAMSPEQLDRLEAVSDALIHLVGYVESRQLSTMVGGDRLLLDELARRGRARAQSSCRGRPPQTAALTNEERLQLRQRILSSLHAERLRVREAESLPIKRLMDEAHVPTPELLRTLGRQRLAIVVPELAIAAGTGRALWALECDTTIELPAGVPGGSFVALEVAGDSMEPLLHSGDTVLVRVDEHVASGTVVVARTPDDGYVVKEVGRVSAEGVELRSINPAFHSFHVPGGEGTILGTVVLRWCPHSDRRPTH